MHKKIQIWCELHFLETKKKNILHFFFLQFFIAILHFNWNFCFQMQKKKRTNKIFALLKNKNRIKFVYFNEFSNLIFIWSWYFGYHDGTIRKRRELTFWADRSTEGWAYEKLRSRNSRKSDEKSFESHDKSSDSETPSSSSFHQAWISVFAKSNQIHWRKKKWNK